MEQWDVIVVGAGAAGLMAACRAAQRGRNTLLLEKRQRPGIKILMSGGTRCNLTHALDARGFIEAFGPQGRFLHSALAALSPEQLVDLVEAEGVATKVESTGKIFPVTDRADDVLAAFMIRLRRTDCTLAFDEPVKSICRNPNTFELVTTKRVLTSESVILTPGGQSYPGSGSTGDGYDWAASLGHSINTPRPALVPITTHAPWVVALQGITVSDVHVRVLDRIGDRHKSVCLAERRGSLLFTHFGVTGPAPLDVSREISGHSEPTRLMLGCDFLPETTADQIDSAFRDEHRAAGKRLAVGVMAARLPQRLAESIAEQAGIAPDRRAAELTRQERQRLIQGVKHSEIPIAGTLGFRKAEVTAGGVSLDEIDSRTMQSKIVPNLYVAGELLDLDGPIGGYNFQAAFSTGWLAGENA